MHALLLASHFSLKHSQASTEWARVNPNAIPTSHPKKSIDTHHCDINLRDSVIHLLFVCCRADYDDSACVC